MKPLITHINLVSRSGDFPPHMEATLVYTKDGIATGLALPIQVHRGHQVSFHVGFFVGNKLEKEEIVIECNL